MEKRIWKGALLLAAGLFCSVAQAVDIVWDNSDGDNVYTNASNWVGNAFPASENMVINLAGANKAVVGPGQTTPNADALQIGSSGAGELEQTGGTLQATSNSGAVSRLGNGSGNSGTLTIRGGSASINAIQLGLANGSGTLTIFDGGLNISRAVSDYSLIVDNGSGTSAGAFEISGGSLITRAGVKIGDKGTFSVIGSAATTIGIGSSGTSVDGRWVQDAGGTLKVRIGGTATGVTKIVVDDLDASADWNGDVTFAAGALLDVGFTGAFTNGGTFTVMEWEGALTNNGLAFAPGVDTNLWSFNADAANKRLTVTAAGAPYFNTNVTVGSISELRQYAGESGYSITMVPGTYWMTGTADPLFLHFSGSNTTFNMTGVHIKVDTAELAGYGSSTQVNMLYVSGNGVVVDGLTLSMEKLAYNGTDAYGNPKEFAADKSSQVVVVTGSDTTIKNCTFTSGGSYPYGYGDAFGKGSRPNTDGVTDAAWISHSKQSGFLITYGASNVVVENVTLNMRSFGHGFFMQGGAHDILFKDCKVLGDTMADSDDIIAHPVYQEWGSATYKEPIPADIRISKHEGAFRTYGNPDYAVNGYPENIANVTITNCLVERMRTAVAVHAEGYARVYDMQAYECEMGFGANDLGETTVLRCKGDALNGPLIYFQYGVSQPATYEIELTGSAPGHGVWPVALMSGDDNRITLTSSAAPGVYSREAYVNCSQKWREWRHRPSYDIDELSTGNFADYTTGNFITNLTDQILVFGKNATANTGSVSTGGVINKGSNNEYMGETLVPAPIVFQDTWSYPPNPTNVPWAQYDASGNLILPTLPYTVFGGTLYVDDAAALGGAPVGDGGTTVSNGTLQVASGFALQGENVVLYGSGSTGQGALYSDGTADNKTRLSSSSGSITLAGDASIGVGVAGNQLLVGPMGGKGNLTKTGAGTLTMEGGANSFDGSLCVSNGWIVARSNKALNDLVVADGAGFMQNGSAALNQGPDHVVALDGTIDINGRSASDTGEFSINIGSLRGGTNGLVTSTSTAATQTVNINSTSADSSFDGAVAGTVLLNKNGAGTTLSLNGVCSHTQGTFVNAGWLGGTGTINGSVQVAGGAGIAPGNGIGTLSTGPHVWNDGALLDIEMDASGHDVLAIDGSLTLNGNAYRINLSAPDIGFDAGVSRSWRIVAAASVPGFAASKFTVDAAAFAANNPLGGGTFAVSESGGDLYLDFSPAPYTALERWRFQQFGSYSNSGDAADGANPDGDDRDNLLEYGVGSDPNVHDSNSVSTVGIAADRLTLTFNRIADPALTYFVAAETNLVSASWPTIWSSTGASNTAGAVIVEDVDSISNHGQRFMRLHIAY